MKHLRKFNESLENDIRQDITEICYDITDDQGFNIRFFDKFGQKYISIGKAPYVYFNFNEVKEVCLRIKDYLGDKYESCEYQSRSTSFGRIDLTDDLISPRIALRVIYINYETS